MITIRLSLGNHAPEYIQINTSRMMNLKKSCDFISTQISNGKVMSTQIKKLKKHIDLINHELNVVEAKIYQKKY